MGCETFGEQLVLLHYGELEPGEQERAREHLRDCAACAREAERISRAAGGLDAVGNVPPPDPERWERIRSEVSRAADAASERRGAGAVPIARPAGASTWLVVRQAAAVGFAAGLGVLIGALAFQKPTYADQIRALKRDADARYEDALDFQGALVRYRLVAEADAIDELRSDAEEADARVEPLELYMDGVLGARDAPARQDALKRAIDQVPDAPFAHRAVLLFAELEQEVGGADRIVPAIGPAGGPPIKVIPGQFEAKIDLAEKMKQLTLTPKWPDPAYWNEVLAGLKRTSVTTDAGVEATRTLQVGLTHVRLGEIEQARSVLGPLAESASAPGRVRDAARDALMVE